MSLIAINMPRASGKTTSAWVWAIQQPGYGLYLAPTYPMINSTVRRRYARHENITVTSWDNEYIWRGLSFNFVVADEWSWHIPALIVSTNYFHAHNCLIIGTFNITQVNYLIRLGVTIEGIMGS